MVARRPTILILAEAQYRAGPEDPLFLDYMRHIVLPPMGRRGQASMRMSAPGPPPLLLYFRITKLPMLS